MTGIIGLKYNGNTYFYEKNLQGDVIGILDSNYNQVVTYKYDSWGKILSIKDNLGNEITDTTNIGIINPFRYRSYYYDQETGWYYLNNRYYNPNWGRFLNADAILGANEDILSYNMYLYCSNNPVTLKDPEGNLAIAVSATAGIGLALSLVGAVMVAPSFIEGTKQVSQLVTDTARNIMNKSSSKKNNNKDKNKNNHNVYVLRDRNTNKVEYVGRTTKLNSAKTRHHNNVFRTHLAFEPVATNISKETARELEELLIMECKTLNRNSDFPMNNQMHGVSLINKDREIFWDLAAIWRDENEVSCN